ncbi:TetR/AcrR family transcriptional regulator [Bacillus safensis]|uniref:TetR/AcrR family transcriptional regulator n=1 Tax=Bacillus TaxID=1386 RepID=UPI0009BF4CE7|nr:TetR/AcrR family transcriptional regulator [Bacillus safensis]ARD55185.1 TetR family transcriptional regulator [Bacillus safensis]MCY7473908.1 TetR/AcrR family transcriptional regulator [Bacillus safensis]MCY7482186.1 TetR/AcrR family transcriptional regulator [Bacillus safensis]MCY7514282.1 TetR/AcrR family transcriptional regulator [Bacillus safensis]MCY7544746.1 TetR/AcrR family transcriptional regulator [Bacillus safensis]
MKDRRTIKTKRAIRESFLELLKEKEVQQITVSELSRKADLGRGTFYLHYQDVFDLYEQLEKELFDQLGGLYDETFPSQNPLDMLSFLNKTTEYLKENQYMLTLFVKPNGPTTNQFKAFFKEKIMKEWQLDQRPITENEQIEASFVVSGVVGVLEEWIHEEMTIDAGKLAHKLYELLLKVEQES